MSDKQEIEYRKYLLSEIRKYISDMFGGPYMSVRQLEEYLKRLKEKPVRNVIPSKKYTITYFVSKGLVPGSIRAFNYAFGRFPVTNGEDYIYHSTFADNLTRIKKFGLSMDNKETFKGYSSVGEVSWSPDLRQAYYWSSISFWSKVDSGGSSKPVLLRALKSLVRPHTTHRFDELRSNAVPPSVLDLWDVDRWISLVARKGTNVNPDHPEIVYRRYLVV